MTEDRSSLTARSSSPYKRSLTESHIVGMSMFDDRSLIRLTSKNEIRVYNIDRFIPIENLLNGNILQGGTYEQILRKSNDEGVRGLKGGKHNRFLSWTETGLIRTWNSSGECISQVRVSNNEEDNSISESEERHDFLTNVVNTSDGTQLITGDKNGIIKILDNSTGNLLQMFKAHESEISGIGYSAKGISSDEELFCNVKGLMLSRSKDKTIQIFYQERESSIWNLLQTLAGQKSGISKVLVFSNCDRILTCCNDRTLSIHKAIYDETQEDNLTEKVEIQTKSLVAYIPEKIITLKSTPCDFHILEDESELVIPCNDKNVYCYKMPTGELLRTFKSVNEKGEGMILKDIAFATLKLNDVYGRITHQYMLGMGNDKSIRVYDYKSGSHICCDWGHSEGVAGLEMIEKDEEDGEWTFVSHGNDGCVFIWSLTGLDDHYRKFHAKKNANNSLVNISPKSTMQLSPSPTQVELGSVTATPVRKVISKAKINRLLQQSNDHATLPSTSSSASKPPSARRKTTIGLSKSMSRLSLKDGLASSPPKVPNSSSANRDKSPSRPHMGTLRKSNSFYFKSIVKNDIDEISENPNKKDTRMASLPESALQDPSKAINVGSKTLDTPNNQSSLSSPRRLSKVSTPNLNGNRESSFIRKSPASSSLIPTSNNPNKISSISSPKSSPLGKTGNSVTESKPSASPTPTLRKKTSISSIPLRQSPLQKPSNYISSSISRSKINSERRLVSSHSIDSLSKIRRGSSNDSAISNDVLSIRGQLKKFRQQYRQQVHSTTSSLKDFVNHDIEELANDLEKTLALIKATKETVGKEAEIPSNDSDIPVVLTHNDNVNPSPGHNDHDTNHRKLENRDTMQQNRYEHNIKEEKIINAKDLHNSSEKASQKSLTLDDETIELLGDKLWDILSAKMDNKRNNNSI